MTYLLRFKVRLGSKPQGNVGGDVLSLTWTNSIDPFKTICKYELHGKCSNPSCQDEHLRVRTSDVEHALSVADSVASLFSSSNNSEVERATLRAKLEIYSGKNTRATIHSMIQSLCASVEKLPLRAPAAM